MTRAGSRQTRGGYVSSRKNVSELTAPPSGPAPGARKVGHEGQPMTDRIALVALCLAVSIPIGIILGRLFG